MLNRPTLKPGRYALKIAYKYVSSSSPMVLTDNPLEARLFSAGYLQYTCWDWQYGHEALSEDALKRAISVFSKKVSTKTPPTSKASPIAILALLLGLYTSAAGVPVMRIRGPVRISSYAALAQFRTASWGSGQAQFRNLPSGPPRSSTIGIIARPIPYRPLKGAE